MLDSSTSISLLWPPGLENLALEDVDRWGAHSIQDLNLNQVAGVLSPDAQHVNQTQIILRSLNLDPRVILLYAKSNATQEKIETDAKAANIHDFVMGLPDRYETTVGERGYRLSGGEKQRLALTRAFLLSMKRG